MNNKRCDNETVIDKMTGLLNLYVQAKDKSDGENVITASCIILCFERQTKKLTYTVHITCIQHWCNVTPCSILPVALSAHNDGKRHSHNAARFSGIFLLLSMYLVFLCCGRSS